MPDEDGHLALTLAAAVADQRSVDASGHTMRGLPEGSKIFRRPVLVDDRGELQEIYSAAWDMDDIPVRHLYMVTILPGVVKGWALHEHQTDRYFLISGRIQVVMYDPRPNSSTYGGVFSVVISDRDRFVLSVHDHVWHADYNCGTTEAAFLNMPTRAYDAANPDKYRLPIDSPLIPYRFPATARGY